MSPVRWRHEVAPADAAAVRALVAATGFFSPAEVEIAEELVTERLTRGPASGYHFVLADLSGTGAAGTAAVAPLPLGGYACFGPISGTQSSFDLYWIAVAPVAQRCGLGRGILEQAEAAMRSLGATRHYAETSDTALYAATRQFYGATGFRQVAHIPDFYRPGDGKLIFERILT